MKLSVKRMLISVLLCALPLFLGAVVCTWTVQIGSAGGAQTAMAATREDTPSAQTAAYGKPSAAADLYERLTPQLVEFYERQIAGHSVVSGVDPAFIRAAAVANGITVQKQKAMMLLSDFSEICGDKRSASELAAENDVALFFLFRGYLKRYRQSLTPEQRQALDDGFAAL